MTPRDVSGAELLVYADWLLDQGHDADAVRSSASAPAANRWCYEYRSGPPAAGGLDVGGGGVGGVGLDVGGGGLAVGGGGVGGVGVGIAGGGAGVGLGGLGGLGGGVGGVGGAGYA